MRRGYSWLLLERLKRVSAKRSPLHIYYDVELNIPFFKLSYAIEHGSGSVEDVAGKTLLWLDPRPLQPHDLIVLVEAIASRFDGGLASKILHSISQALVMVSTDNDSIIDHMLEYIVNGEPLGIAYYDIRSQVFDMIPGPLLVAKILHDEPDTRLVGIISRGAIVASSETGVYAVVEDGRLCGVALESEYGIEIVYKLKCVEVGEYLGKVFSMPSRTTYSVYVANREYVEYLVEKTRRVVEWLEAGLGKKGLLAVSGGKDSVLSALVLEEAGSSFDAVYTHIGGFVPDYVREYVENIVGMRAEKLYVIEHSVERVKQLVDVHGYPVRGYRWCTHAFKLAPQLSLIREKIGVDKAVSYTGSRVFETEKRSLKPATYVDVGTGIVSHSVVYKWPRYLEYIVLEHRYKVGLLEDYMLGFERESCILCPFKSLYELHLSEKHYPDYTCLWEQALKRQLERMKVDTVKGLRLHIWRFAIQPGELSSLARYVGIKARPAIPPAKPLHRAGQERVAENLQALGVKGGIEKVMVAAASTMCTECRICIVKCEKNAIKLPFKVDPSKCNGCLACIYSCPVAQRAAMTFLAKRRGVEEAIKWYKKIQARKVEENLKKAIEMEEKLYATKSKLHKRLSALEK